MPLINWIEINTFRRPNNSTSIAEMEIILLVGNKLKFRIASIILFLPELIKAFSPWSHILHLYLAECSLYILKIF